MKDNPLLNKAYCYHGIGGDIFRLQSILKHGILPQSELKYLNMPEKVPNGYGANGIDKVSVSISPMFCAETNELAYSEGITFVCKSHYFKYHYYCSRGVSVTGSHNDGMSYGISKNNITGIILPNKFYTKPIREYREFGCGYIMLPAVCKKFREFMLKECGYRANAKRYRDIFNRIETEAVEDPLLLIENMENTEKLGELVFEDLQRAVDKKIR